MTFGRFTWKNSAASGDSGLPPVTNGIDVTYAWNSKLEERGNRAMQTKFSIFGQPVELLVSSDMTGGGFSMGRQTCAPGEGVPPHMHLHEDEAFSVISGRFEILEDGAWIEIPKNSLVFAPRGHVHCFRNCGDTAGTIQFVCSGNRFDTFLVGLAGFSMPQDLQAMVDYSAGFGITYPTLPPPSV